MLQLIINVTSAEVVSIYNRLGLTKRAQLLKIKTQMSSIWCVCWWLCVRVIWLDMTTPPWRSEKVMVFNVYCCSAVWYSRNSPCFGWSCAYQTPIKPNLRSQWCIWSTSCEKGKVFYGQEPPSGESTTAECGVNYQLLAVIYWSSQMWNS